MYKCGEQVLIIGGDHKDKFATYLYHDYDSGYYVPFVRLENEQFIVKPWGKDIVSIKNLEDTKKRLTEELNKCIGDIYHWNNLENV